VGSSDVIRRKEENFWYWSIKTQKMSGIERSGEPHLRKRVTPIMRVIPVGKVL